MIRPQERIKRFSEDYHTFHTKVNKTDAISYNAIRTCRKKPPERPTVFCFGTKLKITRKNYLFLCLFFLSFFFLL